MEEQKRVWIYTRRRGSMEQLMEQSRALSNEVKAKHYTVLGISTDEEDGYIRHRPGLKAALCSVRKGEAEVLLTTRTGNISHNEKVLYRVLKALQSKGAVLLIPECQVEKELNGTWVKKKLESRAKRRKLPMPW